MNLFEQKSDIENERAIFDKIERIYGIKVIKTERGEAYDGYVETGGFISSIIEVKRRSLTMEKARQYGSIYMNKSKYEKCAEIARENRATFRFIVQLDDALLHYWHPHQAPIPDYRTAQTKTSQNRHPTDNAMMIHIPIEHFKVIE